MAKVIAIANQKGGVGKTTTSVNLASGLAYAGKKVLLIDFDAQSNASIGLGERVSIKDLSVYDVLLGGEPFDKCVRKLSRPPVDLLPSNGNLAGAELELGALEQREHKLKDVLDSVSSKYDFIIIDCPPSLGLLNTNALTAADSVIIPVQCEFYALEGVTQLLQTIRLVQKMFNPNLQIEGVLLTMFNKRTRLSADIYKEVNMHFKEKTFKTIIPRNTRLSEAPSHGKSIFDYDMQCEGSKAYVSLAKEVIHNNKGE